MVTAGLIGMWTAAFSGAALLYHYLLYPLILRVAAVFAAKKEFAPPAAEPPTFSVVIPCYNEEAHVAAKVANLRAADYPGERVEIIVVSDGSNDGTEAAASSLPGVRLEAWPERRGKPAALNAGICAAGGEVVVFTDANALLAPGALRALAAPFADPRVGAACGEQVIAAGGAGEGIYWRYEGFIKRWEAALASPVGADGSLYAVRRGLCRKVPESRLIMDDFYLSLMPVAAGYRLAYAPAAVAYEDALAASGAEFRRKARIMAGSLAALAAVDGRIWRRLPWQLVSHKILRWLGPAFLALAFAGAVVAAGAGNVVGWFLLIPQLAFYAAAALAAAVGSARAPVLLRAPYDFAVANAALAYGWGLYFFGRNKPAWQKLR